MQLDNTAPTLPTLIEQYQMHAPKHQSCVLGARSPLACKVLCDVTSVNPSDVTCQCSLPPAHRHSAPSSKASLLLLQRIKYNSGSLHSLSIFQKHSVPMASSLPSSRTPQIGSFQRHPPDLII